MMTMNIAECENCRTRRGRRRKNCEVHSMIIKRVSGFSSKIKGKSTIGLCPVLNKSSGGYENIIPRFSNDGKFYLPAFILPTDEVPLSMKQVHYEKNDEKYRRDHQKKVREYCTDKSELVIIDVIQWEPRPNGKSKYCSVCKADYIDYLEHVHTDIHHDNINRNRYNGYINELAEEIQLSNKRRSEYELIDAPTKYRHLQLDPLISTDESRITT